MKLIGAKIESFSEAKTYHDCLRGLLKGYTRETLLLILSHSNCGHLSSKNLDNPRDREDYYRNLCNMIHNQYEAASFVEDVYSSKHMMQQSE